MNRRARTRQLGIGSVLACLLWLTGFEVLPTVHMAFHDAAGTHHHGAGHDHGHPHPDEPHHAHHHEGHEVAHPHADDDHHRDGHEAPARHGENSLAHRHLAAEHSLPTIPAVPEALVSRDRVFERAVESLELDGQRWVERARGPPLSHVALAIL